MKVYPRVGGGNARSAAISRALRGLSPRGRGKLSADAIGVNRAWSIPAWAGETGRNADTANPSAVYPRVGGGNGSQCRYSEPVGGLSPRGRGKLCRSPSCPEARRSIPAWAGETSTNSRVSMCARVYPRVGGGNPSLRDRLTPLRGLSPRGRGKPTLPIMENLRHRSIPAWAGETPPRPLAGIRAQVYPRVGGGNLWNMRASPSGRGLSPRGRGKRDKAYVVVRHIGSIPAWAGETNSARRAVPLTGVYPRVGGGNGVWIGARARVGGLSPRGRGKQIAQARRHTTKGSIPAWAGETGHWILPKSGEPVYPRVGGGNSFRLVFPSLPGGLSPRGRGKQISIAIDHLLMRSIPAWAGETD